MSQGSDVPFRRDFNKVIAQYDAMPWPARHQFLQQIVEDYGNGVLNYEQYEEMQRMFLSDPDEKILIMLSIAPDVAKDVQVKIAEGDNRRAKMGLASRGATRPELELDPDAREILAKDPILSKLMEFKKQDEQPGGLDHDG